MRNSIYVLLLAFSLVLQVSQARAAGLALSGISQEDFDTVAREFSANSTFHPVTAPSGLGSIFGFELGVTAGATKTPDTDAIAKKTDSSATLNTMPHAGLLAAVTVPFGITAEALIVPTIDAGDFKYSQTGLAVKLNIADSILPVSPVNIAVRGFYTKTETSFTQTVNPIPTQTVTYDGEVMGLQAFVSPKLIPFIEPYIGVGTLKAKSKMTSGTAPIFNIGGTNTNSAESSPSSTQFFFGADLRLLVLGLGLEYSRQFGTDSITGKFSFKF